ncbi:hypothetical protein GPECTOR_26g554 [Gonium pectorale]|uniref:Uncharacterized protein n=1 Tax=Gonium pectorale TaxID=33097 RepID=A0A150GFN2_GONPE|nr:hypothetical protein GPECTOR_26g554 [Gonium pectorale]|eukprot:KXZ48651.1 hypothetical protein GPECTOR_26g554 [Gonium pectorale]
MACAGHSAPLIRLSGGGGGSGGGAGGGTGDRGGGLVNDSLSSFMHSFGPGSPAVASPSSSSRCPLPPPGAGGPPVAVQGGAGGKLAAR